MELFIESILCLLFPESGVWRGIDLPEGVTSEKQRFTSVGPCVLTKVACPPACRTVLAGAVRGHG